MLIVKFQLSICAALMMNSFCTFYLKVTDVLIFVGLLYLSVLIGFLHFTDILFY